jgi:uncharacterized protein (DUF433 family)
MWGVHCSTKMAGLIVLLSRDPAGVLRVGKTRVLLALVIRAHQRGAAPKDIVQMFGALKLSDVFAVVPYYLAHPALMAQQTSRHSATQPAFRRGRESIASRCHSPRRAIWRLLASGNQLDRGRSNIPIVVHGEMSVRRRLEAVVSQSGLRSRRPEAHLTAKSCHPRRCPGLRRYFR